MNIHVPVVEKEIIVDVTRRELAEFERAMAQLDIAERALGASDLQSQLRETISRIFHDIPRAVGAAERLRTADNISRAPDYCILKGLRFHELPYSSGKDVRGA